MLAILKLIITLVLGFVFGAAVLLLATAVKIPPNNLTSLLCGCIGMFIALVIIGKASEA